ncbi:hypothetical protein C1I99_19745 [Micromonospora deserti]|uniref:Uncharacterized protein n=2 Tax=Micromonospora deserti TaxID=2070366 RepID=A0A2W2C650_9ACTN|nr:hypothetical protein C1I99_19745 [Micromonospora deserti]
MVAVVVGAVTVTPAPAMGGLGEITAYVWADQPSAADYEPAYGYAQNSHGGVRVARGGTGVYTVVFEGAATRSGVAHAVAYGSNAICTVAGWGPPIWPTGSDLLVRVRCFGPSGAPVDTRFVANFTNATLAGDGRLMYFWADQAVPTGVRTLTHTNMYDSQGGPISYERTGVGRYRFYAPRNPEHLRHFPMVHVTAFNTAAVHCQIDWPDGWEVRCVNAAGNPVDSRFTVTYGVKVDLTGHTGGRFGSGTFYHEHISGDDIPGDYYVSTPTGETGAANRYLSTGRYEMTFFGVGAGYGHAFANPVGESLPSRAWPRGYCAVFSWWAQGADQTVRVHCFNFDGVPTNMNARVSFTAYRPPV